MNRLFISKNIRHIIKQPVRCLNPSHRQLSSLPSHIVVPMPALSPTMEVGSIAQWNLKEGDMFEAGTAICEVETDKATVTYEAQDDGYIAKILVGKGEITVGQPIMVTVNEASDVPAFADFVVSESAASAAPAVSAPAILDPTPPPPPPDVAAAATRAPTPASSGDRVFASPLARKLARDAGLDVNAFVGTGPGGRVVSADIAKGPSKVVSTAGGVGAATAAAAPVTGVYTDFQVSEAAREFATRLVGSKQQVPHYYLSVEINLEKLESMRAELNSSQGTDLGVMDFIIKASALSMKAVPSANASWHESFVRQYNQVDINVVMGSQQDLTIPVIRDVGSKGLKEISSAVADFEDSLYSEEGVMLDPTKVAVGTFSIHNLGMYGVKSAAPIVLPPQGCCLAVGAIIDTVVPNMAAKDGEDNWKVSPVVITTMSCDHRVIDGAVAAAWLASFKNLLENPVSMLL